MIPELLFDEATPDCLQFGVQSPTDWSDGLATIEVDWTRRLITGNQQ